MVSYTTETIIDEWFSIFRKMFDAASPQVIVRSPGRVNLIGEHTDYNLGYVLPAAIDKAMYFALSPRTDTKCRIYALDIREWYEGDVRSLKHSEKRWPNYLLGVVDQLFKAGYQFGGFDCVFGGNVPIGAGLSSSAAIEGGLIFGLNEIFHLKIDKMTMVKLAQKAENEFVGVRCGIMDQFVNIFGEDKKVIRLDCRSLEYEQIPFERSSLSIILCETIARRELASSEYNVRRRQCEDGVKILSVMEPSIKSLRDVDLHLLERYKGVLLSPTVYNRCEYVVKENARVIQACEDLKRNDFASFGARMFESHEGLSKYYEVSNSELDFLVKKASEVKGVLGSRMMGAGFGGCTINLVEEEATESFTNEMKAHYQSKTSKDLIIHIAKLRSGTELIS